MAADLYDSDLDQAVITNRDLNVDVTEIPYQVTPEATEIGIRRYYEQDGAGNLFQIASVAEGAGTRKVIAVFGEGITRASNSNGAWGGNFVGVGAIETATAIAVEVNPVNVVSGAETYGVVVAASGDYDSENALQVQANNDNAQFKNGIEFNAANRSPVLASGSLIDITGDNLTATHGIDFTAGTFSGDVIKQEDWTDATLENSWANYGAPYANAGFFKTTEGVIHLRGAIKDGTTTSGTNIFTLPTGYRPEYQMEIVCMNNGAFGRITIETDGNVKARAVSATLTNFDGISFKAA
jgi:hypothetical protein